MIPNELPQRTIDLPRTSEASIVVITGTALRHDRFALRLQEEFGDGVVAWLQVRNPQPLNKCRPHFANRILSKSIRVIRNPEKLRRVPSEVRAVMRRLAKQVRSRTSQIEVEESLFRDEVERLRKVARVSPKTVDDPNTPDVVQYVASLRPYFIVTLGGAIYKPPLLQQAQGIALNQHDGWCPEYKGSNTVQWALYHRDIVHLGNTIHVLTTGMDAGPIVRRSTACVVPTDTPESCFARSVALGTELMCEVIHDIKQSAQVTVFDQPPEAGSTLLFRHLSEDIQQAVLRDFKAGWLPRELQRVTEF